MQIKLDTRFQKKVRGMFEKYNFEVGVLQDGVHKEPKTGKRGLGGKDVITTYAGGSVRKKSNVPGALTIAEVSEANRARLGINYLTAPFQNRSSDIIKFTNQFFNFVFGRSEKKRLENTLQAIVRNPILRGEYGTESQLTKAIKGFSRPMIDTAQLFKSIKAVCKVKARV